MALHADWTAIEDKPWMDESKTEEERDVAWAYFNAVIMWTMACGIGEVTKDNYAEFYLRYTIITSDPTLKIDHFRAVIGLKVNVVTETTAQFLKNFRRQYDLRLGDIKRAETRRQKEIDEVQALLDPIGDSSN